ncbi:YihY/virulence factor BrkB family protein [Corynebacterium hylobatis]|uniref:YihY/virulence factor BrkB family protein n=1 Tax=Corynebacterium hylobatis TaxID=1859290 RepID=UPI0013DEE40E|nr:YihY/virulence factor BrkB family protein [Corynebacterium hylobatis]
MLRLDARGARYVLRRVVREFFLLGVIDMAAKLTFFTLLAVAPTILAIYSIATIVLANNAALVSELTADFITTYIPEEYRAAVTDLVNTVIGSSTGGIVGLIVGTVVALWSASAYVRAFSRCANTVYEQTEGRPMIAKLATMLGTTLFMVVGMVLILASVMLNETVVNATLGLIAEPLGLSRVLDYLLGVFLPVWRWLKWPIIFALSALLLAVLYYVTPNVRQARFRWLSIGACSALIGIALVSVGFWIYLNYFPALGSYGAIGSVLALMFALWGANIFLILGVKIDAEIERVHQLKAGVRAERQLQLPPRSIRRTRQREAAREKMAERGRDLRLDYLED